MKKYLLALALILSSIFVLNASAGGPNTVTLTPDTTQIYGTTIHWSIVGDDRGGWVTGECVQGTQTIKLPNAWYDPYYGREAITELKWDIIDNGLNAHCKFQYEDAWKLTRCSYYPYPPLYRCMMTKILARIEFDLIHP